MLELLSPAGSPEAIIAAVQNGADAVYLGMGEFNARRGAKNFAEEEFEKAVRYCRIRGCKVYLTLNTLVSDRETEQAVVPERGARLGNFTVASGCGEETWLITAEWMQPKGCEKYGSDNSLWLVKMSMDYAGTRQATAVDR